MAAMVRNAVGRRRGDAGYGATVGAAGAIPRVEAPRQGRGETSARENTLVRHRQHARATVGARAARRMISGSGNHLMRMTTAEGHTEREDRMDCEGPECNASSMNTGVGNQVAIEGVTSEMTTLSLPLPTLVMPERPPRERDVSVALWAGLTRVAIRALVMTCGPIRAQLVNLVANLVPMWLKWTGGRGLTTADAFFRFLQTLGAAATTAASHLRRNGAAAGLSKGTPWRHFAENIAVGEAMRWRKCGTGMRNRGDGRQRGSTCPAWASWARDSSSAAAASATATISKTELHVSIRRPPPLKVQCSQLEGAPVRLGARPTRTRPLLTRTRCAVACTALQFVGKPTCLGRRGDLRPRAAAARCHEPERE